MIRERALKILLALVGLLFITGIYPLLTMHANHGEQMLATVYITLGVFLLLAARNPSAHRSLIAFTAWSNLAHAAVMAVQAYFNLIPRADLLRGGLPLVAVGVAMIVLAPARITEPRTQTRLSSPA